MSTGRPDAHESASSRIFVMFPRWPLVPSADLYRLQAALTRCADLEDSGSARELLLLVTDELERRTAEPGHLPSLGSSADDHGQ
ncbi:MULTISPECIES: hypothetical protein [Arthrobacter]|uniref:Uncharacterized protein n=1 Tax=Arthrobacter oryzae TaxID=409290 RepID=A0A3N0C0D0_9MICC|nr:MULTISPECIES: hypothetical protein [Arthrobacter]QYF90464.1 hypothetical protein KY499_03915 [Arthrobacter sp. PAMC25284]RNL55642.1 hypothetical protein D7003_09500 [Arthrobacter oryzae]